MQHSNLFGPRGSPVSSTVRPCSTTTKLAGFAGHSGARVTSVPFKTTIDPPPKFATDVNVWSSPPLLVTRTVCPARMLRYEGSNRQAGCPTKTLLWSISGENSTARNSANVVSPRPTHVLGPTAALNVMGSQLSASAILGS